MSKFKNWVEENETELWYVAGCIVGVTGCLLGLKIGNTIVTNMKMKNMSGVEKNAIDILSNFKQIHCWKAVKDITVNDAIVDIAHEIIMEHRLDPNEIVKGVIITTAKK